MTAETFYLDQAQYEAIRDYQKKRRYYKKQSPTLAYTLIIAKAHTTKVRKQGTH